MEECQIILHLITAYNPQSDGQSERMNQVVKTMIHYLTVEQYKSIWLLLIPQVEYNINASTTEATRISLFKVLHRVPPQLVLIILHRINNFLQKHINTYLAVCDVLEIAQAYIVIRFDINYKPPVLTDSAYIQLAEKDIKGYCLLHSLKISLILHSLFPIKRKINDLTYKLDLPDSMHIHPVISVMHLEPCMPDDWQRVLPEKPDPVIMDRGEQFKINKILKQSVDRCLVWWC